MSKRTILFVDDEPNILKGVTRLLRPKRSEWAFHTCERGTEALEWLSDNPCDLVISDVKMPGMNGIEFLRKVRSTFPDKVRLILSGQVDKDSITDSIGIVHQYLSKPCAYDELHSCLNGIFFAESRFDHTALKPSLCTVSFLPVRRNTYDKLCEALQNPVDFATVAGIIDTSPQLTSLLLKITNSPYFGARKSVYSGGQAFKIIGVRLLREIIECHKSELLYEGEHESSLEAFERYSFLTGYFAKNLAALESADSNLQEYLFTAALLHAVGLIFLAEDFPHLLQTAEQTDFESSRDLHVDEELGATFTEMSAYLLSLWGAPIKMIEAICTCVHPDQASDDALSLAHIINVASNLALEVHQVVQGAWPLSLNNEQFVQSVEFLNLSTAKINGLKEGATNV
jgi:HD-like signal output (HDOD) protein/ActR/RegA family two-component response regulator